jgi:hypothetical protein
MRTRRDNLRRPARLSHGPRTRSSPFPFSQGYLLIEALAYFALLLVLLGVGYLAVYRCIDNATVLARNANDITAAMNVGERWRADIRAAGLGVTVESSPTQQVLHARSALGQVDYRYAEGSLYRRAADGPWGRLLNNIKSSAMQPDPRPQVAAWRWELELQPRAKASVKASRIRPLFTFFAAPPAAAGTP